MSNMDDVLRRLSDPVADGRSWEMIAVAHGFYTSRLRVPGGWLYVHQPQLNQAPTCGQFVPDPPFSKEP